MFCYGVFFGVVCLFVSFLSLLVELIALLQPLRTTRNTDSVHHTSTNRHSVFQSKEFVDEYNAREGKGVEEEEDEEEARVTT